MWKQDNHKGLSLSIHSGPAGGSSVYLTSFYFMSAALSTSQKAAVENTSWYLATETHLT